MNFDAYSDGKIQKINSYIDQCLQDYRNTMSVRFGYLIDAMDYSLSGSGKRLRPLLLVASADYVGLDSDNVLPAAAAVEFLHTYSLIHDDLPALDDDDMRRGKPANHKRFGEAVAILTGDALLTEAFGQMLKLSTSGNFAPNHVLGAIELLVHHGGVRGMVGGQLLDVTTEAHSYSLPEVEFIHIHKTGSMILASAMVPARLQALEQGKMDKLRRFGEALGLAFQISDDLLDSEASVRYSRGPRSKPKPTYCDVMSPSEVKQKLNSLIDSAIEEIEDEGEKALPLVAIAEFVRDRKH